LLTTAIEDAAFKWLRMLCGGLIDRLQHLDEDCFNFTQKITLGLENKITLETS